MPPILFVSTIVMLILMCIGLMLAIFFAAKKPNQVNKALRNLSLLFFVYFLFSFLDYYFKNIPISPSIAKSMTCISDICYFALIFVWLKLIGYFSERPPLIKDKLLSIVFIVYVFIVEATFLLKSDSTSDFYYFSIEDPTWRTLLSIFNGIFDISVAVLCIIYLVRALKFQEKSHFRRGTLFFSITLFIYMIWVFLYDIDTIHHMNIRITNALVIDPAFIAYCIVDIVIILFMFRKDPLELFSSDTKPQQEQLEDFVEKYKLTKREADVIKLVCEGLNNPDIADALYISEYTVKRHLNNIFQKAGVKNRYELIAKALSNK